MSRFGGKLVLVLLERRVQPSIRSGRSLWGLHDALSYQTGADKTEIITVPAGFVTDLASIPRVVWSFFPPDGPWVKGAVVHDFLYFTQGDGKWYGRDGTTREAPYTRRESDDILREAMADRGIGAWAQFVIWTAVRLGGWIGWAQKHKRQRVEATRAELATPAKPARPRRRKPA